MLITCPSCANQYTIAAGQVGAGGRKVRCAACRSTWLVTRETEPAGSSENDADVVAQESGSVQPPTPLDGRVASAAQEEAISADAQTARNIAAPPQPGRRPLRSWGRKGAKPGPVEGKQPPSAGRRAVAVLALAATIAAGLTAVLARAGIVGLWPETAMLYQAAGVPVNLRGLTLNGVRSELQTVEQERILVVEGEIANAIGREIEIPRLALAIQDTDGEALYTWTNEPPRRTLGPGETARFRARLASPPAEGRQVLVRFASASDGTPVAVIDK